MSEPAVDPRRYDRLAEHAERYLGRIRYGQPPDVDGRNRGFAIAIHDSPDGSMISACSTGVRFQSITATLPEEIVCSARPGQEDEASYLVHVVADRAVQSGRGYEYEGGYVNAEPLIPGTGIEFLLAVPHPYVAEEFNLFRDGDGELALQYLTLVPATRAEFDFLGARSVDDLFDVWDAEETDLLDVYRASAV